jgi:hypothetical protein
MNAFLDIVIKMSKLIMFNIWSLALITIYWSALCSEIPRHLFPSQHCIMTFLSIKMTLSFT